MDQWGYPHGDSHLWKIFTGIHDNYGWGVDLKHLAGVSSSSTCHFCSGIVDQSNRDCWGIGIFQQQYRVQEQILGHNDFSDMNVTRTLGDVEDGICKEH